MRKHSAGWNLSVFFGSLILAGIIYLLPAFAIYLLVGEKIAASAWLMVMFINVMSALKKLQKGGF